MFTENQSALHGFFRRRVAHPWDAQDLTQEVYLRLLRADDADAEAIRNPEAYLFTITANLMREHAVLQQRGAGEDIDGIADAVGIECRAGEEIDAGIRQRRLAETIERLPPKCKAVMLMQYREGLSYREIADRLGVSTHMVKKYVVKALASCRSRLARYA